MLPYAALREHVYLAVDFLHARRYPHLQLPGHVQSVSLDVAHALPVDKVPALGNRAPPAVWPLSKVLGEMFFVVRPHAVVHQVASVVTDDRGVLRERMRLSPPRCVAVLHQRRHLLERDLGARTLRRIRRHGGHRSSRGCRECHKSANTHLWVSFRLVAGFQMSDTQNGHTAHCAACSLTPCTS